MIPLVGNSQLPKYYNYATRAALHWLMVLLFIAAPPVFAQAISKATWVTPIWEGYVDESRQGLYYEVISAIYEREKIRLEINFRPWTRALFEVESGLADFTGADSRSAKFIQPRTPIIKSNEVVFFRKSSFPTFRGIESLEDKTGIWVLGYTDNFPESVKNNLNGKGNPSREAAFQMLLLGRADYFLDNDYQMAQTLKKFGKKFKASDYGLATVYSENLYMCFTHSPRGQRLADIFDERMKMLSGSGELKRIYAKWSRFSPSDQRP